jgi:phosphonate degradation associated HDIG domain protein
MDNARVDHAIAPLIAQGAQQYGEAITQYAHAVQCAFLAQEQSCAPALIAAALLHDVGQMIADAGHAAQEKREDARHEETGADFLAAFFGPEVTEPVRLHVAAKRYLCAVQPDYRAALSQASELSLQLQGGVMDADEAKAFKQHPYFHQAIALRGFDDAAKRPDWAVPPLESYRPLLVQLLVPMDAAA